MINFNIFELTQDLEKLHASLMRRKGAVIEVVRARMTAVFTQLAEDCGRETEWRSTWEENRDSGGIRACHSRAL